jgi:hypothetical protein
MRLARHLIFSLKRYHGLFLRHPGLAVLCLPVYVGLAAVAFFLFVVIELADSSPHAALPILALFAIVVAIAAMVGDLLLIQILAVASGIRLGSNRRELLTIIQSVLATVTIFALIYYYMQLFSENRAFENMTPIEVEARGIFAKSAFFYQAISQVPRVETVVDCFYFSLITITTVGYGDIHPATTAAKLVSMAEIIFGYLLLVLSIGAISSSSKA